MFCLFFVFFEGELFLFKSFVIILAILILHALNDFIH